MQYHNQQQVGRRLLEALDKNELCDQTAASYRVVSKNGKVKPCAVGLFLPDNVANFLSERGLDICRVSHIKKQAGIDLSIYLPGLSLRKVQRLQDAFDSGQKRPFRNAVRSICELAPSRRKRHAKQ
jgi:hypothetical protein